jgi:adenosylmethionine-8-amino-7-oxononanoate aminotransferase
VLEQDAGAVARLAQGAREAGALIRPLMGAVAVSPPLIVEREHLQLLADAIRHGLDSLDSAPPRPDPSSGG